MLLSIFPKWDTDLFKTLNGLHSEKLDPVMLFLSSPWSWILLFIIVAFFMLKRSRFWGFREILLITIIIAANSIINNIIKLIIKRPRPCQNELFDGTIRALEDCGTHYSFFSAHSSNAFCLAICTALFFRNKYYSLLIIIWAAIVAYSRIYVGKHYPLDVIVGILFGVTMSIAGNYLLKKYREENHIEEYHPNN